MPKDPTTRGRFPRPSGSDPDYPPDDFTALTDRMALVSAFDDQGPISALQNPVPALRGTYYWATDSRVLLRCTGDAWVPIIEFPIGGVLDWPIGNAPPGPATWLELNGQAILKQSYPLLFDRFGVSAAAMNLPDRRGRTAIGAGSATSATSARTVGQNGGEETHALTVAELPAHSHPQRFSISVGPAGTDGQTQLAGDRTQSALAGGEVAAGAGGDQAHNNMPPFIVTRYFIRAA